MTDKKIEAPVAVKPLKFSEGGYAHNGLGTMYRITFHNDAAVGWVLYRHEGSSQTGLGCHEDREELEKLADKDNERRILSALTEAPGNTDPTAEYDDELRVNTSTWRVRPLEWYENDSRSIGRAPDGHYWVLECRDGQWGLIEKGNNGLIVGQGNACFFNGPDDAKLGADILNRKRILSNLDTPQPKAQPDAVRALQKRLEELDNLCATAERRGPSQAGYVTDATFYNWCGQRSALQDALRALTDQTEAPND